MDCAECCPVTILEDLAVVSVERFLALALALYTVLYE